MTGDSDLSEHAQTAQADLRPQAALRQRRIARQRRLRHLGFADYRAYLRSREWRIVRERYWASDLPRVCVCCGSDERLQLHHRTYERVGEERLDDLVPLCIDCHGLVHVLNRRGDIGLDLAGLFDRVRAIAGKRRLAAIAERGRVERTPESVRRQRMAAAKARTTRLRTVQRDAIQAGLWHEPEVEACIAVIDQAMSRIGRAAAALRDSP